MSVEKVRVIGLTLGELESFAVALGEAAYRGRQLYQWLYTDQARSFEKMSDLPARMRAKLTECAELATLIPVTEARGADGTTKFLFELADGLRVESVYLPDSPGETACISSQVGCAMGCHFCATAKMGLYRNLTAGEIVSQVILLNYLCKTRLTNIVYMGMGEPLHNYDEVVKSLRLLTDKDGMGLAPSRVTVSTVGILPALEKWIKDLPPAKLAFSLHATTDERRMQLMPVNRAYPLEQLTKAIRKFAHVTRYGVTFEYIMIAGYNDRREDAANLKHLLRNIPAKINLIRLHPTGGDLVPSSDAQISQFMSWLVEEGITCTLRASRGVEESAACGMLYSSEPFRPSKVKAWEKTG